MESTERIDILLSIAILCAKSDFPDAVIPVRKYNKLN
tara:strand:+ start:563 stop:673 length:111 start_codon:yes stop_codon:yes gene_type:complete